MRLDDKTRTRPAALDTGASVAVALLQTPQRTSHVKAVIMSLLAEHGAMTHDAIYEKYLERTTHPSVPMITEQSCRTRTHALVVQGLVRDTGKPGRSRLGNKATVWGLA